MKAIILAGGLGNRLKPFTNTIPKPLLPIGERSVLEIQISHLVEHGFKDIYIATYYKADFVKSMIGINKERGVNIVFSEEPKPLGTCGPISLLKKELNDPFVLVNGDILTSIDFRKLVDFGEKQPSDLTVVTKKVITPFNFGKVESKGDQIISIEEKPNFELEILAGIYFMKPSIMRFIPDNEYYGIDSLIKKMLARSESISKYLMTEYWLDIGTHDSYNEAQVAYEKHFKQK